MPDAVAVRITQGEEPETATPPTVPLHDSLSPATSLIVSASPSPSPAPAVADVSFPDLPTSGASFPDAERSERFWDISET